jgi:hypothetical protein
LTHLTGQANSNNQNSNAQNSSILATVGVFIYLDFGFVSDLGFRASNFPSQWARKDSDLGPMDYESTALPD